MAISPLDDRQIQEALQQLPDWELREGKLYQQFVFANFVEAFSFMTAVALLAEQADHHPEWSNVYNRVRIYLTTHDAGGLSARDTAMASAIDQLRRQA